MKGFQSEAIISKWGENYYKVGSYFKVGQNVVSNLASYFKVKQLFRNGVFFQSEAVIPKWCITLCTFNLGRASTGKNFTSKF